jgi:hypothetical protein
MEYLSLETNRIVASLTYNVLGERIGLVRHFPGAVLLATR